MDDLVARSEFPLLSADPHKLVVDAGFPLHKFRENQPKAIQHVEEHEILPRTNDFRPTPLTRKADLKHYVSRIFQDVPELSIAQLPRSEVLNLLSDDIHVRRSHEAMDPLIGNSLAHFAYDGLEYYLVCAGPSLSNLVLLSTQLKPFEYRDHQTAVNLPFDAISIHDTIDLQYPIRQITTQLSNNNKQVVLIRTTSTIHLFVFQPNQTLDQIHTVHVPQLTATRPTVDYSMPIHATLSPFDMYHYAFITNNGYMAIVDGLKGKWICEEEGETIPDEVTYCSRWRSCAFGKSPFTLLVASPECIQEKEFTADQVKTTLLAKPNERIIAFHAMDRHVYCFSTLESVVIMDQLVPQRPVMTWQHQLRGLPFHFLVNQIEENQWSIMVFTRDAHYTSMMTFSYDRTGLLPKPQVLETHNMELSVHTFEEFYEFNNRIKPVGILCKSFERPSTLFGLYRIFEDGSMRVHYIARDKKKGGAFISRPAYRINQSHTRFEALLNEVKLAILPERTYTAEKEREVVRLDMTQYQDYLQEEVHQDEKRLNDKIKPKIASSARQIACPMSYKNLLEDHSDHHTQEELFLFLTEMQQYEPIELIEDSIKIPSVLKDTSSTNPVLHQKLLQAHAKEIKLASTILRPLKQQDNKMEYLPHVSFESTTTTKVMASCWTLDDRPYSELVFPEYDTETVPVPETFPSVQATSSSLTASVPTIVLEDADDELPDIPTVASVKIKTSSQKKEEPEEEEEEPLFMSSQNASRPTLSSLAGLTSPARSFANVSTQPLAGAFGSRQKSVAKKKKKPKTSGFK